MWLMQTDSAPGGWMAVWACNGSLKVRVVVATSVEQDVVLANPKTITC